MQGIFTGEDSHRNIGGLLEELGSKKFLLVCGSSFLKLDIRKYFEALNIPYVMFSDFTPNPVYEDVYKGVRLFNYENCDAIVAVGGGSAIDVAKCIKLFCKMDCKKNYLTQEYMDSGVPLIAVPTTAGTGSESTRYAVIYHEGKKQSIAHESIIPNYAVLEHSLTKPLPIYQKKCSMIDALCQGIESWWSVNSTEESKGFSRASVRLIMENKDEYIGNGSDRAAEQILLASNFAGRAINITQTTAPHAMSYKLTSLYKLPHGHAAGICLAEVWEYMTGNMDKCMDSRGSDYLHSVFLDISKAMGCKSIEEAVDKMRTILSELELGFPVSQNKSDDLELLAQSVNLVRLVNNPVSIDYEDLISMYERIVI